jgi:DNA adenine methylase
MGLDERRFPSPLRYPGGKGKIANFLKLLFTKNNLAGHGYAEPYAGGASVALQLLYDEYASHIYINDLNRSIYAFWWAVLNDTDALCARISSARLSIAEWKRQRAIQSAIAISPIDLAFSTFYLNRTNRSGIISGGVIGGLRQRSTWGIEARFNKPELIRRIHKIARYRNRITLTNVDAAIFLQRELVSLPHPAIAYLDPPYYGKGADLYESYYQHADHEAIAAIVGSLERVPWIVSYDRTPEILRLYSGFRRISYGLKYSAQERYSGSEVMFFAPNLSIPQVNSPANIQSVVVQRALTALYSL